MKIDLNSLELGKAAVDMINRTTTYLSNAGIIIRNRQQMNAWLMQHRATMLPYVNDPASFTKFITKYRYVAGVEYFFVDYLLDARAIVWLSANQKDNVLLEATAIAVSADEDRGAKVEKLLIDSIPVDAVDNKGEPLWSKILLVSVMTDNISKHLSDLLSDDTPSDILSEFVGSNISPIFFTSLMYAVNAPETQLKDFVRSLITAVKEVDALPPESTVAL